MLSITYNLYRAQNDLKCEFSDEPAEEIATQVAAYGAVRPGVLIIWYNFGVIMFCK